MEVVPLYMRHAADPSHSAVEFAMLNAQQSPEVHRHCKKSFNLNKLPAFVFMHRNEVQPALETLVLTYSYTGGQPTGVGQRSRFPQTIELREDLRNVAMRRCNEALQAKVHK